VNFGPLTPEITRLMFTHPKSIVGVLCMIMHLSAGLVTATGGILPLPPIRLRAPGGLTLGFASNF